MKKLRKITLTILAIIACVLIMGLFYESVEIYRDWASRPLGPLLDYAPPPAESMPIASARALPQLATPMDSSTATPPSAYSACADLPPMMILGIGSDARADDYRYGRADVIRAIRVDFQAQKVTVLAFPRDLWVEIPEIEDDLGTDHQKLNTAYIFGNPGLHFWDHPSEGPGLLALTLEKNFGLKSDHYLAVSMDVFVDAVDALGGLDFYFPEEIDGRSSYDRSARLVFPAGQQHLNGEQSLTLARIRNVSTFARTNHQNQVMCTLQEKIKSPETITKIPALIDAFKDNIQTDLTPAQISQLACLGSQMPKSNVIFASFPRELFSTSTIYDPVLGAYTFIWESDFDTLRAYVTQFQAGTWPPDPVSSSPSADPAEEGIVSSSCE